MKDLFSYLIFCLLFSAFYFQNLQAQTNYDVFPLSKGLYYKYDFHQQWEIWEFELTQLYSDSGSVEYFIQDSLIYGDSLIVWTIEQRTNLLHRKYLVSFDTTYPIIDTSQYFLYESLHGKHELACSSLVWFFPLIIHPPPPVENSPLTEPDSSVYRYSNSSDFIKTRSYQIICAGWVDSVWFSNEEGMYKRVSDWFWQCGISFDFYNRNVELIDGPSGVKQNYPNMSDNFTLYQNFPNPFNPSTSIQFAISNSQFVSIKVYDVLGKEIATLVNEQKPAGEYNVEFNGTGLPSGIYFYQIRAGNYLETKKMVLIK